MPTLSRRDADLLLVRSLTRVARGDLAGGLAAWREAQRGDPSRNLLGMTRPTLLRVEGRVPRVGSAPASPPPAEPASEAWARAWAGDLAGARKLASEGPESAESLGVLGAVHVLERRAEEGLALLDRAIALGGRQELLVHRARALVHLGRQAEASRALEGLVEHESLGRQVLVALLGALSSRDMPVFQAWRERVAESETFLNGLFSVTLPAIVGGAEVGRALASPAALAAFLEGLLDRMAGNLGPSPTFAEIAPDGARRFVRLAIPPATRALAIEALHSLRHAGADGAEAALAALSAERPRSVHARCYRGELYLWLGRYDDARREFLAGRAIERARWVDIGMLAVLVMTGDTEGACRAAIEAETGFPPIPGGTLPVYRGALRRRMGDLDGAIADLAAAVAVKPTRVGARIELCLALRAAGRRAEAKDHAAELLRDAAPLLVDAADRWALDWRREPAVLVADEVLEAGLHAMQGNRSSAIATWIDATGALRALDVREALEEEARRVLAAIEIARSTARSP